MSPRVGRQREPLSRDRIVAAAIAVADERGLAGLSMRAIARELGVEAMSLYHHVAGREDILDGVVDDIHAQFYSPQLGQPWRREVSLRSRSARAVIRAHPWVIPIMNSRRNPGMATMQHLDSWIGLLRGHGFSLPLIAEVLALVDSHLYGFVAQEATLPLGDGDEMRDVVDGMRQGTDFSLLPHLSEFVAGHVLQEGYDFGDEFDRGLDLILDGFERKHAESMRSPNPDM